MKILQKKEHQQNLTKEPRSNTVGLRERDRPCVCRHRGQVKGQQVALIKRKKNRKGEKGMERLRVDIPC